MAIEASRTLTDKTVLAAQHDDRISPVASTTAIFRRVEDTGRVSPFGGPVYNIHPEPYTYTIKVTDVPTLIGLQAFALGVIVTEAMIEAGVSKTAAEVSALVTALLNRGISFDHARTAAWEDLESRRRAGEAMTIQLDVTEGKRAMADAGILV